MIGEVFATNLIKGPLHSLTWKRVRQLHWNFGWSERKILQQDMRQHKHQFRYFFLVPKIPSSNHSSSSLVLIFDFLSLEGKQSFTRFLVPDKRGLLVSSLELSVPSFKHRDCETSSLFSRDSWIRSQRQMKEMLDRITSWSDGETYSFMFLLFSGREVMSFMPRQVLLLMGNTHDGEIVSLPIWPSIPCRGRTFEHD
jgi:hypothetical protein